MFPNSFLSYPTLIRRIFAGLACIMFFQYLQAQTGKIDSLKKLLPVRSLDSNRVIVLNALAIEFRTLEPEQSKKYLDESIPLASKIKYKKGLAVAYNILGNIDNGKGEYDSAIACFRLSAGLKKELHDEKGLAGAYFNMGTSDVALGKYEEALGLYLQSLQINEKFNNLYGIGSGCNGLGLLYDELKQAEKALEYYKRALKVFEEMKNEYAICTLNNNIGLLLQNQGRYDEAMSYYTRTEDLLKDGKDKSQKAILYANIGNILYFRHQYEKALLYTLKAEHLHEEMGNQGGLVLVYLNLGNIYDAMKDYKNGELFLNKCVALSSKTNDRKELCSAYFALGDHYADQKFYDQAYRFLKMCIEQKDTLFKEGGTKQMALMSARFEVDKKDKAILLLNKDQAIKETEIREQKAEAEKKSLQLKALFAGLALLLILAVFIYRGYRQKQVANRELDIKNQKIQHAYHLIEEKNKDITDSINYAQRIQNAILPTEELVKALFPESFVLFRPKDIVSGDFYFVEKADDIIYLAVADCTGHGVPGAMVSVVGHNSLTRAIHEFGLREPGRILDKLSELVEATFTKHEKDVKDGMDISLCALHLKTRTLEWAGANNPLWIIRKEQNKVNATTSAVIKEWKADKQPVGKHEGRKDFTTHSIQLEEGDTLICFSDGYADQFGGEKGKKFKYKPLQELLCSIVHWPMDEQKKVLLKSFENWKGSLEQVDDVCIIGARL
ncbi:MAG: tetratricopeptide repeat protein [Bacteroidia bacterium]